MNECSKCKGVRAGACGSSLLELLSLPITLTYFGPIHAAAVEAYVIIFEHFPRSVRSHHSWISYFLHNFESMIVQ